jgi:hypothetical protein
MVDPPDLLFESLTLAFMTADSEPVGFHNGLSYKELISVFNDCFQTRFRCQLESGHSEPLYLPATKSGFARLCFREDFASSALHEVAHWCIAGEKRRQLEDFGYWYKPDGRTVMQQMEFESVEIRPQALEWLFSLAAGIRFQVSVDNLAGEPTNPESFKQAVYAEARKMLSDGLPPRGKTYLDALKIKTGCTHRLETLLRYQDLS